MDFCDPDFDLLLDELRQDATSIEDYSSCSSPAFSQSMPTLALFGKKPKSTKKSKTRDDSSIDSDTPIVKPRILKTDIRRSYPTMLLNVMDSGDFPLIYGFFETFFHSNMQSSFTRPNHMVPGLVETVTLEQKGVKDAAMYFYSNLLTKPDAVLSIKDCNIVSPKNSLESQVVTNFNIRATMLLDELPASYANCPSKNLDSTAEVALNVGHKRNKSSDLEEKSKAMRDLMTSVDNAVQRLSLLSNPFQIDAIGRVTLYLDENKRVRKIEMKCEPNECMKQYVFRA